jgi:hypothetical protein
MSKPLNASLYAKVKNEAKRKFKVWPSAYASAWLVKEYKRRGGKYAGKRSRSRKESSGIDRWMREKWINVCKLPRKVSCGRSKLSKSWKRNYPVCRPSIRVNSKTPTLASQISKSEIKRICSIKRKSPLRKLKKIKSRRRSKH